MPEIPTSCRIHKHALVEDSECEASPAPSERARRDIVNDSDYQATPAPCSPSRPSAQAKENAQAQSNNKTKISARTLYKAKKNTKKNAAPTADQNTNETSTAAPPITRISKPAVETAMIRIRQQQISNLSP